jgi:hypothetical protein
VPHYGMHATTSGYSRYGRPEADRDALERAIAWYRARPSDEAATRGRRYGPARTLCLADQWEEAQPFFEGPAAEAPDNLNCKGYLGVLAARSSEREGALCAHCVHF